MERLQKVIASYGYASRRKAEKLIQEGKVFVNGKKITELGVKVGNDDKIVINGVLLTTSKKEYYLLNKPRGIISSTKDEKGRTTVVDLIKTSTRIYPIGRLDYDTTGIILLTNDGELANKLMHPSKGVEKTYVAKLNKVIDIEDFYKLKKGIVVDNQKVKIVNAKIKAKDHKKNSSLVEITIIEGRNHIVKKIFETLGYDVVKLKREKYDFLTLDNLKSGEYRLLTIKEIKKLYRSE